MYFLVGFQNTNELGFSGFESHSVLRVTEFAKFPSAL